MEVHQDASAVADVAPDHGAEGTYRGAIGTRQGDSAQMIRQRPANAHHRSFVYEAGPCGSGLYRYGMKKGLLATFGDDGSIAIQRVY
jgi:hypothetical protein